MPLKHTPLKSAMIRKIELLPHNLDWSKKYIEEAFVLKAIFSDDLHSLHQIGSTAIFNADAQPIIDILALFHDLNAIDQYNDALAKLGYEAMGEYGIEGRRFFWRDKGNREFHIHAFQIGHQDAHQHLIFREYMNNYPKEALRYSKLKQQLAKQYPTDIQAYVDGKIDYINKVFEKINADPIANCYDPLKDPIELESANPEWPAQAKKEIELIQSSVPKNLIVDIQHAGSTAIKGIDAKPLLDIFIAVDQIKDGHRLIEALDKLDYQFWADNPNPDRMFFVKGMPPRGVKRTHHIHIVSIHDERWKARLFFRDYLNTHPETLQAYQQLKRHLAEVYRYDREAYTVLKSAFITEILEKSDCANPGIR